MERPSAHSVPHTVWLQAYFCVTVCVSHLMCSKTHLASFCFGLCPSTYCSATAHEVLANVSLLRTTLMMISDSSGEAEANIAAAAATTAEAGGKTIQVSFLSRMCIWLPRVSLW